MPLDRFVLILVGVVAAAGVTVALLVFAAGAVLSLGLALAAAIPVGLVAYVVLRVISDRLREAKDDPYDRIDH